jgi:hypothetical protein
MSRILDQVPPSDSHRPLGADSATSASEPRDLSAANRPQAFLQHGHSRALQTRWRLALGFALAGLVVAAVYLFMFWPGTDGSAAAPTDSAALVVMRNAALLLVPFVALGFVAAAVAGRPRKPDLTPAEVDRLSGIVPPAQQSSTEQGQANLSAVDDSDDAAGIEAAARLIARVNWAALPQKPAPRAPASPSQTESIYDPLQWLESFAQSTQQPNASNSQPASRPAEDLPWWLAEPPARTDSSLTQPRVPRFGSWYPNSAAASGNPSPAQESPRPAREMAAPEDLEEAHASRLNKLRALAFSPGLKELDEARHGASRSAQNEAPANASAPSENIAPTQISAAAQQLTPQPAAPAPAFVSRHEPQPENAANAEKAAHLEPPRTADAEPEVTTGEPTEPAEDNAQPSRDNRYDDVQILPSKRGQYYRRDQSKTKD